MANLILINGKTGTGKSRAIKNLDPDKTYVINVTGKDLPFPGARKMYNRERKNMNHITKWDKLVDTLNAIPKLRPEVNTIIIDDARHIMENEFIERATEVGYTKFTQLGQHMVQIFLAVKEIGNEDMDVFMMFHTDDIVNGTSITSVKAKLVGKLVEDHFDPYELATICLFTNTQYTEGKTTYRFITNLTNIDGITIPAKSPEGMFDLVIENDLAIVKDKIHKYYKGEE